MICDRYWLLDFHKITIRFQRTTYLQRFHTDSSCARNCKITSSLVSMILVLVWSFFLIRYALCASSSLFFFSWLGKSVLTAIPLGRVVILAWFSTLFRSSILENFTINASGALGLYLFCRFLGILCEFCMIILWISSGDIWRSFSKLLRITSVVFSCYILGRP